MPPVQKRDATIDRWLTNEVAPVADAMCTNPNRALSADQVAASLAAHHATRRGKSPPA